ncbi:tape measure protein [Salmonella enterica subsp. salamae serovar 6,7:z:1,5]|nr:tape measure protein [Salmonella enterica subsp. salamae serovar 6,7:z:1,5]EHA0428150.1 tape measure protein [Salmonella enterica subsp. enterica serovar Muenchen]
MASSEQVGNIVYQVQMDVAELIASQKQVNQRLDQMDAGFNKSSQSASRFEGALNKVGVAIAAAFTIETAKRLVAIGDEMNTLQARVTRLSPSIDQAKDSMRELSAIASQTGSSLADTERLWESLTSSLKQSGATNRQILSLTSTLQKIGTIGGSSTEEMSNALRQFGQSISGGIVRAEEFNSILEQMPELARQIAAGMGVSIGELRSQMLAGKLTAQDALNAIQKQSQSVNDEFDKMPISVERAKNSLDVAFKNAISDLNQAIGLTSTLAGLMQAVADNLNYYNNNVGDSSRMPKLIKLQQDLNGELKDGQRWYETDSVFQVRRAQAAVKLKQVEGEIAHIRAKSQQDAKNNQFSSTGSKGDDALTKKLMQNSERRLALAKVEGEARARLQAQYDAADAGITDSKRIKSLQDEYAETYRVTEARKESDKVGRQSASQTDAITQKLENLRRESELSASSTEGLTREQQLLRAEQSLGAHATEEQKKQAREYKAAALDSAAAVKGVSEAIKAIPEQSENKSYTESMQNLSAALNAGKISQQEYNAATEKMEQEHQSRLAKIRSQQVVTPQQQAAGTVDPVQQLKNTQAQQLELINQYEQQGVISHQRALELKAAADTQYQQNLINTQWQIFEQQSAATKALGSAFDSMGATASNAITGVITGSTELDDALRSIGMTVLNSVISSFVQMGIDWAKSAIMGQTATTTAVAASTAAQTAGLATTTAASTTAAVATASAWTPAAILSSVASFGGAVAIGIGALAGITALSGKRKNGGPVSAGGLYQVGEGGAPEIFKASNGNQYMIPGDNGSVISNRAMNRGGSGSNGNVPIVNNYVINQSTNAQATTTSSTDGNGNVTIQTIVSDIEEGGAISQAISRNFATNRRATE